MTPASRQRGRRGSASQPGNVGCHTRSGSRSDIRCDHRCHGTWDRAAYCAGVPYIPYHRGSYSEEQAASARRRAAPEATTSTSPTTPSTSSVPPAVPRQWIEQLRDGGRRHVWGAGEPALWQIVEERHRAWRAFGEPGWTASASPSSPNANGRRSTRPTAGTVGSARTARTSRREDAGSITGPKTT